MEQSSILERGKWALGAVPFIVGDEHFLSPGHSLVQCGNMLALFLPFSIR
jgi:hypothetical protein